MGMRADTDKDKRHFKFLSSGSPVTFDHNLPLNPLSCSYRLSWGTVNPLHGKLLITCSVET